MYSFWERKYWLAKCDFVIVGSGIVGVNTAINIKQKYPKSSVVIVERGAIPTGASTKNAGFACFGTVGEIVDDLKSQSYEEVIETVQMRWEGLQLLNARVPAAEINYKVNGGYEVFTDKNAYELHQDQLSHINEIIETATGHASLIQSKNQGFSAKLYEKTLFNPIEAQLNPGLLMKYLISKASGLGIVFYNNFSLKSYTKSDGFDLVFSNGLELHSEELVFCTNAFFGDLHTNCDVIPARNQVIVTAPIKDLKLKGTFHFDKGYIYFRNVANRLLIGGARNQDLLTEETTEFGENHLVIDYLKSFAEEFLEIEIKDSAYTWSGIIATGKSKKPIIKRIENGPIVAVRLGGMGVAIGSLVAYKVLDLV